MPANDILAHIRYQAKIFTYLANPAQHPINVSVNESDLDQKLEDIPKINTNNYPNPFNPDTNILFTLPYSGHIDITVFDLFGREILSLLSEVKKPGRHSVYWNGKNSSGKYVASGIYIYRIVFEGQVIINKMLRIK